MDGYLEHGKFKYIDKYRSKAGKWVYRYKQDAQDLKRQAEKKLAQLTQQRKKRSSERGRTNQWHTDTTATGYAIASGRKSDKTRKRVVTDPFSGRKVLRTEYHNPGETQNSIRMSRFKNAQYKVAGIRDNINLPYVPRHIAYHVMELNDKYGPKIVGEEIIRNRRTGEVFVSKVTQNLIGGRKLEDQLLYSYNESESKPVKVKGKKRTGKRRAAVKKNNG